LDAATMFTPQIAARVPGQPISRRIAVLMSFMHEYLHGIFDEAVVPREARPIKLADEDWSIYLALTEGFAVMNELLIIDKMVAARQELGLSDKDVADLKRRKQMRILTLRTDKDHYTLGTIYFWHKIYKQGGEAGMLEFLRSLDHSKISRIYVSDPEFLAVKGKPDAFKKYLAK
jgi:hypothetical protein